MKQEFYRLFPWFEWSASKNKIYCPTYYHFGDNKPKDKSITLISEGFDDYHNSANRLAKNQDRNRYHLNAEIRM